MGLQNKGGKASSIEEKEKSRARRENLKNEIQAAILKYNPPYGEVKSILDELTVIYMEKGRNLLNSTKIQEVSQQQRRIR